MTKQYSFQGCKLPFVAVMYILSENVVLYKSMLPLQVEFVQIQIYRVFSKLFCCLLCTILIAWGGGGGIFKLPSFLGPWGESMRGARTWGKEEQITNLGPKISVDPATFCTPQLTVPECLRRATRHTKTQIPPFFLWLSAGYFVY